MTGHARSAVQARQCSGRFDIIMTAYEIVPGVHAVGTIDWDRRIFDELVPLPQGTSYNAFLIQGSEKTALIDTSDPEMELPFITNLMKGGVGQIDYVVVNHAEQDHSGLLPLILELYSDARVVTNATCKDLLKNFLGIADEKIIVIKDGETLSLGDKTLEFLITPWVHWPDTMLTYLKEDKILFSCDLFGAHLATSDLFMSDTSEWYTAAKRYYAEIMMPFRNSIKGYLERLKSYQIAIICPSHGPIHGRPETVLEAYADWTSDEVKNTVVIPYISMHGSTKAMVDYLVRALTERGVGVKQFQLNLTDTGDLAMALVDAATIVIATPTVLFGPHPKVVYAAYLANILKPKTRFVSVITSYGWGGKTVDTLVGMLNHLKVEVIEPVTVKGYPTEETQKDLIRLADEIVKKHKESIGVKSGV